MRYLLTPKTKRLIGFKATSIDLQIKAYQEEAKKLLSNLDKLHSDIMTARAATPDENTRFRNVGKAVTNVTMALEEFVGAKF